MAENERDDDIIDCRTVANREFNARMRSMGREDLCVAEFYTRAEIAEMRAKCKARLSCL
jgi:hypothetical protein